MLRINIAGLIRNNFTYPNRNGNRYELRCRPASSSTIEIYYEITNGAARRIVRREFPRIVTVDSRFVWLLGLLRGEGLKSIGARSSMYRFNVVNNDLEVIKVVIRVLDESKLAKFDDVKSESGLIRISYGPYCDVAKARRYWAEGLGVDAAKIRMADKAEPQKRALYGSCMFTLNDVILRRVVDLIAVRVYAQLFGSNVARALSNG